MSAAPRQPNIADVLERLDDARKQQAGMQAQLTDIQRRLDVHDQLHKQISADMSRFGEALRELHLAIYGSQNTPGQAQRLTLLEDNVFRTSKAMTTLAVIVITPFVAAIVGGIIWAMTQAVK